MSIESIQDAGPHPQIAPVIALDEVEVYLLALQQDAGEPEPGGALEDRELGIPFPWRAREVRRPPEPRDGVGPEGGLARALGDEPVPQHGSPQLLPAGLAPTGADVTPERGVGE